MPLLAAAYLGFYVFGLVMGAYTPTQMAWATIVAGLCTAGLIVFAIARRMGVEPVDPGGDLGRSARAQRERRGW